MLHLSWKTKLQDCLLLLLVSLACYWPFSLFAFSAKNDNIIVFLPYRHQISEALRSGHLPLWSPYIYLGFPLHGDMQSGCWNPFVWLISLFGNYDLYSLQTESLLYIFLSGLGMYYLLRFFISSRIVLLSGSIAYLCCGFITDVGGSNLPFLASAAFVPFVFGAFLRYLRTPSLKTSLLTALLLVLLLVTAYPSFFILTIYVLFFGKVLFLIRNWRKGRSARPYIIFQSIMLLAFLAVAAPAIFSYWQLLPFYTRGGGISMGGSLQNSFHPGCSLSFLLPAAAIKNPAVASTDLISRNAYFNSFFLAFLLTALTARKNWMQYFLIGGIIYFFLFSLGSYTPVRGWSYYLPLMNTFRHPSNARLFLIIPSLLVGAIYLDECLAWGKFTRTLKISVYLLMLVCLGFLFYSFTQGPIGINLRKVFSAGSRTELKFLLDHFGYADALLLNSVVQFLMLAWLAFCLSRKTFPKKMLLIAFISNSILFAQFTIPFTFTGKADPAALNQMIHSYPSGFQAPSLSASIEENGRDADQDFETYGIKSFYNKKPALPSEVVTPTFLNKLDSLYQDSVKRRIICNNPFAYFADTILPLHSHVAPTTRKGIAFSDHPQRNIVSDTLRRLHFSVFNNNEMAFQVHATTSQFLCLQQVYLPGWKATIDNKPVGIESCNIAFMGVVVPAGTSEVRFNYHPAGVIYCLFISLFALVLIAFLFYKKRRR